MKNVLKIILISFLFFSSCSLFENSELTISFFWEQDREYIAAGQYNYSDIEIEYEIENTGSTDIKSFTVTFEVIYEDSTRISDTVQGKNLLIEDKISGRLIIPNDSSNRIATSVYVKKRSYN